MARHRSRPLRRSAACRPQRTHYYPALSYTSFVKMSLADIPNLMAYLRGLRPVSGRAPEHELPFPHQHPPPRVYGSCYCSIGNRSRPTSRATPPGTAGIISSRRSDIAPNVTHPETRSISPQTRFAVANLSQLPQSDRGDRRPPSRSRAGGEGCCRRSGLGRSRFAAAYVKSLPPRPRLDLSQGKRLYTWFNYKGCHADGGANSGPAFLDGWWRKGPSPDSIYLSIRDGRPRGMPSYRELLTHEQIWQLAGYVRSIGTSAPATEGVLEPPGR